MAEKAEQLASLKSADERLTQLVDRRLALGRTETLGSRRRYGLS